MPFSALESTVPLPDKRPFPADLQTIGNHLKHARLTRNILIKDVCSILNITRETLRAWEHNIYEPFITQYPLIISFLGYNPCNFETDSLGGKIKSYRHIYGLTQDLFGKLLDTNGSVVWQWENNKRIPLEKTQKRILKQIGK